MKDKIYKILYKSRGLFSFSPIEQIIPSIATEQLTALMCYREVRAYCAPIIAFYGFIEDFEDIGNAIYIYLKDSYNKEIILQAIEQVKNEQK